MKTSSKTHDDPEAKPQQILTDHNASEKASSHFLKEHDNSEISLNQIVNLRKKLTLLITLAIALAAFLMTACEDDPELCNNCSTGYPAPAPNTTPPTDQIAVRSIHPSAGTPGSTVNIILDNFSGPTTDEYVTLNVTFGPSLAEILYARYGMIIVRVPMDLKDGDYTINMRANGQVVKAPSEFKVYRDTN